MKRVKEEEKTPEIEGKGNVFQVMKNQLMEHHGHIGGSCKAQGRRRTLPSAEDVSEGWIPGEEYYGHLFRGQDASGHCFCRRLYPGEIDDPGDLAPLQLMLLAILFALFGFYLPDLWLRMRISARKEEIARGFPDALDLLVVCVEAGWGWMRPYTGSGKR